MKRTQVIRITPCKKKNAKINSGRIEYFNKLSKNEIGHLLNFLDEEDQLKLIVLDKKFKAAILNINEVDEKASKNWYKCICSLMKLKNDSKGFSPYLNVYLNINIINTNLKYFGLDSENINKVTILKNIIERNYHDTKLDRILIQINEPGDFNLYYSIFNSIKKEVLEKLKFDVDISPSIVFNSQTMDISIKLFSLITFENVMPFKPNKVQKLAEIQDYFISNNIKIMHKYIWSMKKEFIDNAEKYFSQNENCLLGINNQQHLKLIENNYGSIKYLNIQGHAFDEFNVLKDPKFTKIKFDYPSEEFTSILLNKIIFSNLEQISGLVISKKNINEFIKAINSMKTLKKITRIKFGLIEEEEEDENIKESLFKDFFLGIQSKHGQNLLEITTWWKKFKKGKDYDFILSHFPNIRKIQEDYDASGLYDIRLEIDKIFSCNAEDDFQENDLIAITKIVKNYIKQKKEGENSIKFELYNCFPRLEQLINYWKKNDEKEILNKINYINFVVSDGGNIETILPLNKLNVFDFKNDNFTLISTLKEIKVINQVILNKSDSLQGIKNLLTYKVNLNSIVIMKDNLEKDELNFLKQIKNLKYLILDDKIINENKMNEGGYPFMIISKKYFANTTEMP